MKCVEHMFRITGKQTEREFLIQMTSHLSRSKTFSARNSHPFSNKNWLHTPIQLYAVFWVFGICKINRDCSSSMSPDRTQDTKKSNSCFYFSTTNSLSKFHYLLSFFELEKHLTEVNRKIAGSTKLFEDERWNKSKENSS